MYICMYVYIYIYVYVYTDNPHICGPHITPNIFEAQTLFRGMRAPHAYMLACIYTHL